MINKKWEDVKAGDLFRLNEGFFSVGQSDCAEGVVVEVTHLEDEGWVFKGHTGDISDIAPAYCYLGESELAMGQVEYVGRVTKFKSSIYNTEYTTLEDAVVDLVLTEYFDNNLTFKDGLFGEVLFDSLTMEQKKDFVMWIMGIETV